VTMCSPLSFSCFVWRLTCICGCAYVILA
jgi:hypothetical protein